MTRAFNELKRLVLNHLASAGPSLSREIARSLAIDVGNAKMCMLRLRRQGLVSCTLGMRIGKGRRPWIYSITNRGIDRLKRLSAS